MPLVDPSRLQLGAATGRFDVDSVELCDSTNSELLRRAEQGAPSGTVLVADRQTAGRGRRGRTWWSTADDSLTFSVLWRFSGSATRLSGLSLAVGLAVAQALEALGVQDVGLKWPNDILLRERKLAGVLVELSSDRRGTMAVIGIGLNLAVPHESLPQPASGLSEAMAVVPERHEVLASLLTALAAVLDRFAVEGFSALLPAWQGRHVWQNRPVRVLLDGSQESTGICRGADEDGALLLETPVGLQRLLSGDVSLRAA